MQGRIIDCCSLINLYTGWGGLAELPGLGWQWYLCEAVLKEAEYTREYGEDGQLVLTPLDFSRLISSDLLLPVAPAGDEELEDYLDFACEVDDGEAQALSIAKHRGFTLLTDDRKAIRLAARPDIAVSTISTASILKVWAGVNPENEEKLPGVISRIEELARFAPRRGSSDYEWWSEHR
jgi:hypothetical protein